MNFIDFLKNIKGFTKATIKTYSKYAWMLEQYGRDYQKVILRFTNCSNNTKRLVLSAIKAYYKFLNDKRYLQIELPKKETKFEKGITYQEYQSFIQKIKRKTKLGFMKYLIVRLLFETGIRSKELLMITKNDIQNNKIKIWGKGRSQRIVTLSKWLAFELQTYLNQIETKRIFNFSYKNLYQKIASLDKNKKITPHMFRRGYARYCYKKGISIYDIALTMGHSDINTTAGYVNKNSNDVDVSTIFN